MENAVKVASVMGPVMVVMGLSILLYPKTWKKVTEGWLKNHYQMIPMAIITLVMGIIAVKMYNVWTKDIWVLVTIGGWAMIVKSVFYFLAPGVVIKWAMTFGKHTWLLVLDSLILLAWGGVLSYYTYFTTI